MPSNVVQHPALVSPAATPRPPLLEVSNLSASYGASAALQDITLNIYPQEILGLAGKSGAGRTTFLRCISRPLDGVGSLSVKGNLTMRGRSVRKSQWRNDDYRRRFVWIGPRSPMATGSVFEAVAARLPNTYRTVEPEVLDERVAQCLAQTQLCTTFEGDPREVDAATLNAGQRLQLDLARGIAANPEILLVDLRCSTAQPSSMRAVEETLLALRRTMPIVLVSDDPQQLLRLSDRVACFGRGRLVEIGATAWLARGGTTRDARRVFSAVSG